MWSPPVCSNRAIIEFMQSHFFINASSCEWISKHVAAFKLMPWRRDLTNCTGYITSTTVFSWEGKTLWSGPATVDLINTLRGLASSVHASIQWRCEWWFQSELWSSTWMISRKTYIVLGSLRYWLLTEAEVLIQTWCLHECHRLLTKLNLPKYWDCVPEIINLSSFASRSQALLSTVSL